MPEHADEPAEYDWLLAFPIELGGKPPESKKSLAARVECLEEALHKSTREIESLKSELATLVATVDDIGKKSRRQVAWTPKPTSTARSRFVAVAAGVIFGVVLGVLGWALWSRASIATTAAIDTIDPAVAAWVPVAEEPRVEAASPPQPVVSLAAATPQRVTEPAPTVAKAQRVQAPVEFVGTLSIDATPGGEVFIDRRAAGQTPLHIQKLKAGSHLVWIEREGYRRFTRVVQVAANRVSRVSADLEPIPER